MAWDIFNQVLQHKNTAASKLLQKFSISSHTGDKMQYYLN